MVDLEFQRKITTSLIISAFPLVSIPGPHSLPGSLNAPLSCSHPHPIGSDTCIPVCGRDSLSPSCSESSSFQPLLFVHPGIDLWQSPYSSLPSLKSSNLGSSPKRKQEGPSTSRMHHPLKLVCHYRLKF